MRSRRLRLKPHIAFPPTFEESGLPGSRHSVNLSNEKQQESQLTTDQMEALKQQVIQNGWDSLSFNGTNAFPEASTIYYQPYQMDCCCKLVDLTSFRDLRYIIESQSVPAFGIGEKVLVEAEFRATGTYKRQYVQAKIEQVGYFWHLSQFQYYVRIPRRGNFKMLTPTETYILENFIKSEKETSTTAQWKGIQSTKRSNITPL